MTETIYNINGINICSESFGDKNNPAILLIMGAMASMIWWNSEFCKSLSEKGYYVIRFDNRDVGCSTFYEPGKPQYNLTDMADDAFSVLDAHNIEKANFVGMSLGGMVTQIAALKNKTRVITLTLISTSVLGPDNPDIPPISKKIVDHYASSAKLDWSKKAEIVKYMTGGWELHSGSAHPFDKESAYKLAEEEYERAGNLPSMFNHALLNRSEEFYGRLGEISQPALIIHGTEDPILPYKHALALHEELASSELITLLGRGHEIHKKDWNIYINQIDRMIKQNKEQKENLTSLK